MTTESSVNSLARFLGDCSMYVGLTKDRIETVASYQKKIDDEWDLVENYGANPTDAETETKYLVEQRDALVESLNKHASDMLSRAMDATQNSARLLNDDQRRLAYQWIEESEQNRLLLWPQLKAILKVELEKRSLPDLSDLNLTSLNYYLLITMLSFKSGGTFEELRSHPEAWKKSDISDDGINKRLKELRTFLPKDQYKFEIQERSSRFKWVIHPEFHK